MNEHLTDMDPRMDNAVSVYESDAADEFPVLKAFQQYIDAEQSKARKRMMLLCIFFSFVLTVVIAVFVVLLISASSRNQSLNDRLVEYAMKDRDRIPAVQTPVRDDSAIRDLSRKIESLSTALDDERKKQAKAAEEKTMNSQSAAEALEIKRLKALLAVEKEKSAVDREKLRQAELEAYRRKHYPELYERKPAKTSSAPDSGKDIRREAEEADKEIESILKDVKAVDYFKDDEDEDEEIEERPRKKTRAVRESTSRKPPRQDDENEDAAPSSEDGARVPSGVKDASGNTWGIPLD